MSIKPTFIVSVVAILVGCAATQKHDSAGWAEFQRFEKQLEKDSEPVNLSAHLSKRIMSEFEQVPGDKERQQFMTEVSYPLWLAEETAHFEKSLGDSDTCLTVIGRAPDNAPASVSIRYVQEAGQLKADEVLYELVDTTSMLPEQARCPSEFELEYPAVD